MDKEICYNKQVLAGWGGPDNFSPFVEYSLPLGGHVLHSILLIAIDKHMKTERGFSAIELMTVMAVVVSLVFVGMPSLERLIVQNRMVTEINDFVAALSFARSEAIKRSVDVVLCKSLVPNTCATSAADCCSVDATVNWSSGWVIFADVNGDRSMIAGDGDILIGTSDPRSETNTIKGTGTAVDWIRYDRNGFSPDNDADTVIVCSLNPRNDDMVYGRTLSLNGRVVHAGGYLCP